MWASITYIVDMDVYTSSMLIIGDLELFPNGIEQKKSWLSCPYIEDILWKQIGALAWAMHEAREESRSCPKLRPKIRPESKPRSELRPWIHS